jgi:hypothetical protein
MKLLYVKANVFTASYRCTQVRQRLIRFINQNPPLAIAVSGMQDGLRLTMHQFTKQLKHPDIRILDIPGQYQVSEMTVNLFSNYLSVGELTIVPIEGTVAVVEKVNRCRVSYMLFDIFAEEEFADYNGELDDMLIEELTQLLKHGEVKDNDGLN